MSSHFAYPLLRLPVSTSTSDESLVVQEASARLNRWQAIWLLLLIQLMAVLAVVSSQPVGFSWLSWRDLPGLLLLVIAIVLQLTTASFENTDSHQANRRVKVLFVIPLITWIGLWGHQSVVAQVVGGLASQLRSHESGEPKTGVVRSALRGTRLRLCLMFASALVDFSLPA